MAQIRRHVVAIALVVLFGSGCAVLLLSGASSIRQLVENLVAGYLVAWGLYSMLSNLPRVEIGQRFILMTLSLGVCVLLAETVVVLRLVDYREFFGGFDPYHALGTAGRQFDRELLWRHEPYYHFEADYQGNLGRALCVPPDSSQKVEVRYDRNGFRNASDLNAADIVIIGDSYIESPITPPSALITTRLARLQGKTVANLGHSGYGPQQELAVLKRFGLPLKPRMVIWAFFEGNDLSDMEEYPEKAARVAGQHAAWENFWFRSFSKNLLSLYFRGTSSCVPNSRLQRYTANFGDAHNSVRPVLFAPSEIAALSEGTLRKVQSSFSEAYRLCRDHDIRFVVVFVPEKYRVYHDLSNVRLSTDELRSWTVNDLPRLLHRLLAELSPEIGYVDLTRRSKPNHGKESRPTSRMIFIGPRMGTRLQRKPFTGRCR